MAKRDIRVNYGTLNSLVEKLTTYEKALGEMESAVQAVGNMLSNGSGLAITNLVEKSKELQKKILEMKTEVTDISGIIKSYVNDMTSIIAPISQDKMMQVDRNDIWWNLQSIINACERVSCIPRNVGTYGLQGGFSWDDDEDEIARKERNYDKLCDIKSELSNSQSAFSELIDKMKALYKKVQNYENMDDAYKKKADGIKKKYTDFWEGVEDFLKWVGEGTVKLIKGFVTELAGSITGLFSLVVGVVKYAASAIVVNFDKVTNHKIPEWAEMCYNGTNESVAAIVKDPVLIVEGMAQSISDTYEEEGIAYCTGYTVGAVAEFVIGSKGASKLGKAGKAGKVAGKVDDVGDAAKVVDEVGETAKVASKVDIVEEATQVASKIEKVEEVAKVGDEAGDAAKVGKEVVEGGTRNVDDVVKAEAKSVDKIADTIEKVEYGEHYTRKDRKKVLKSNVSYETPEGYVYKTNEHGAISEVEGTLKLGDGTRNEYAQRIAGREYRLPDDDGGHLIGTQFLGSGELDNLVPMNSQINRSGGKWYSMESEWSKALHAGKEVKVKIEPIYNGDNLRPVSFKVKYNIEGQKVKIVRILNQAGG